MSEFSSTNGHAPQLTKAPPNGKQRYSRSNIHVYDDKTVSVDDTVTLDDFLAYMPSHTYIFRPTRDMWPAKSVNARVAPIPITDASGHAVTDENGKAKKMAASTWLDRHQPVEQMTWSPGMPELIRGRLIADSGWFEHGGATTFNLYRPPQCHAGDPNAAGMWISHVRRVFGADANHIIMWLAHRAQRPHEKVNHALVLGGHQGIGKDTLLEPVKHAIGSCPRRTCWATSTAS